MKKYFNLLVYASLNIAFAMISCQKDDLSESQPVRTKEVVATVTPLDARVSGVVLLPDNFAASITEYEYSVAPASQLNLKYPAMKREQWRANLVLTFMVSTSNDSESYYAVPGRGASGNYWMYKNDKEAESVVVFFDSQYNPVISRDYDMAKILILEPAQEPDSNSRRRLIENLTNAGVDLNDYQQLIRYFGMENF